MTFNIKLFNKKELHFSEVPFILVKIIRLNLVLIYLKNYSLFDNFKYS